VKARRWFFSKTQHLRQIQLNTGLALVHSQMVQGVNRTWDVDAKIYSQFGEDGILYYLMKVLDISKPRILEIGVGDFGECNSRFLVETLNASVVAVDINKKLVRKIASNSIINRSNVIPVCLKVTPDNIDSLISYAKNEMLGIDVLSIDIDGNDYWVLNQASMESISVIVAEYNPIFGCLHSITVTRNDDYNRFNEHYSGLLFGCSIKALMDKLSEKNFAFIGTNRAGNNAFFVHKHYLSSGLFDNILNNLMPISSGSHTDWRFREERDKEGKLTYRAINESMESINNEFVFHIDDNKVVKFSTVCQ